MKPLEGRTAIVTGAGSGIGRAVALAYARDGARVVVSDISDPGGNETVQMIATQTPAGEAKFFRADVGRPEDHDALVRFAMESFGALHVACNNAGVPGEVGRIAETTTENWQRVIDINLSGVFYALRAQVPAMLKSGGGAIVNVASILGAVGQSGSAAYVASKHGVVGLTKAAALEYATRGLRINCVGPGYIDTPLLSGLSEERFKALSALHPIGRLGRPEEVAELVAWLSSDKASFATGDYYPLDGGYLAR